MHSVMFLFKILKSFSPEFSRKRSHIVFCMAALSIMCGYGATCTEMTRFFGGGNTIYSALLRLFASRAWGVAKIQRKWAKIVYFFMESFLYTVNGKPVYILDRTIIEKHGTKISGVSKQFSTVRKHAVNGHALEVLGIAVNKGPSTICLPLAFVFLWKSASPMQAQLCRWLNGLHKWIVGPGYLVADAYYSKKEIIKSISKSQLELVSRVRIDTVGYKKAPTPQKKKRGRPKTYGDKVELRKLFGNKALFKQICVGGEKHQYYSVDLLWDSAIKPVRFLLLKVGRTQMILLSTDLALKPKQIAEMYLRRSSIERSFRFGKQSTKLGNYKFWSKEQKTVLIKRESYKKHIMLNLICQGILQILAIKFPKEIWAGNRLWIRTLDDSKPPSEEVTQVFLESQLVKYFLRQISPVQKMENLLENILKEKNSEISEAERRHEAA